MDVDDLLGPLRASSLLRRASTSDTFEKLIQETFQWTDAEADSNLSILFPQGIASITEGSPTAWPGNGNPQSSNKGTAAFTQCPTATITDVPAAARAACTPIPLAINGFDSTSAYPPAVHAAPAAQVSGPKLQSPFAGLTLDSLATPAAATAAAASSQQQQQQQLLHHQHVMQEAQAQLMHVHHTATAPGQQQQQLVFAALAAQPEQQQQQQKAASKRRGRPLKADGNYSQAYLALKQYRARKKDEVDHMEAELAAKLAQLAALEEENRLLKNKQEVLENTIGIQHSMVKQVCAQQQAVAAAAVLDSSSGSSSNGQADVSAVVAAVTAQLKVGTAPAAAPSSAAAAAADVELSPNNVDPGQLQLTGNPNWTHILAHKACSSNSSSKSLLVSPEQLHVPVLLDRYRHYVAAAAHGLNHLAAVLQEQQPEKFTVGSLVSPAAVGEVQCEDAAALGVSLPQVPFTLAEFMALGNDERIPPALPAINLLTGAHESIEPEIWRVVAAQIILRPGQADKLAAAWTVYEASLQQVNAERASLMQRLKEALDTCHRSSAAADSAGVGLSEGGVRLGLEIRSPNDTAVMLSDERLLEDVLNHHEYYVLSEAIDANMAREDGIMILFDYAIMTMLDDVQLCQVAVSSWPFFPLMGSICVWLLGGVNGQHAN